MQGQGVYVAGLISNQEGRICGFGGFAKLGMPLQGFQVYIEI